MCSFSQTGKQLFKHHGGLALLDTKDDLGFVRCSLYYTTNPQIAEGPWLAIGSKAGGDDLIALGNEGDFDHGLCYSAPPVSSGVGGERGGSASFFYWGVNGEHYAPHNASFGVATVPKGRYVGLRARDAQQTAIVQTVALVCSLPRLFITVDASSGGEPAAAAAAAAVASARVRAQVVGEAGFSFRDSTAVVGKNVTGFEVTFGTEKKNLAGFVGRKIKLEFELRGSGAALYSFGFGS